MNKNELLKRIKELEEKNQELESNLKQKQTWYDYYMNKCNDLEMLEDALVNTLFKNDNFKDQLKYFIIKETIDADNN